MDRFQAVIAFFILVLLSSNASAGMSSDCEFIARDGVMKKTSWVTSDYAKLVLLSRYATSEFSSVTNAFGHTGNVQVGPIKIGPGTWNMDRQQTLKKELEQFLDLSQVIKSDSSLLMSSGDPEILKAITDCVHAKGGLAVSLRPQGADQAILTLEWTPYPTAPTIDPRISDITVRNGKVIGGHAFAASGAHLGIRLSRSITLSRDSTKDLAVVVNTIEAGSGDAYLPTLRLPDAKVCKIEFGFPLPPSANGVPFLDSTVSLNSTKYDCVQLALSKGAADVRLGCESTTEGLRFANQRFCVIGATCAAAIPGASGGPFAPNPNCGWN